MVQSAHQLSAVATDVNYTSKPFMSVCVCVLHKNVETDVAET